MVEEYGGVVQFAGLIVRSGINAFQAAEKALQEIPLETRLEQNDRDHGICRSGWSDYRVGRRVCRCSFCLKLASSRRRRLHRRSQAQ